MPATNKHFQVHPPPPLEEAESSEGISSRGLLRWRCRVDSRWRRDRLWQEKEAEKLGRKQPVSVAVDGFGPQSQQKVENQLSFDSSAVLHWSFSDARESSLNELAFSVLVSGARASCILWYSHAHSVGIHWELAQPFSHIKIQGDSNLLCHMA